MKNYESSIVNFCFLRFIWNLFLVICILHFFYTLKNIFFLYIK